MGTHISRVKSVDLDAWTDEQLQSVLKWGNSRANKYWEAKLAPAHVPSEAKIENFIRTKYESKRWVMDGPIPDPSTLDAEGDDDIPLNLVKEKHSIERSASQKAMASPSPTPGGPAQARRAPQRDLFGDDMASTPRASSAAPVASRPQPKSEPAPPKQTKPADSLLGLDFFGEAPPPPNRPTSAAATPGVQSRPDLKQSILSLYASAPRHQPTQQPSHSSQGSFGGMQSPQQQSSFGSMNDAFSGLSFSNSTSPPPQPQPKPSAFAGLGNVSSHRSTFSQGSSPPLSGGSFFDAKPVQKPAAAPPQPSRGFSSSSGFGAFDSAPGMSPAPLSSATNASSGIADLFDFSSPAPVVPPKQIVASPTTTHTSVFNLSQPAPPPKSEPAAPTLSSGWGSTDAWGSNDAWGAAQTSPVIAKAAPPQARSGSSGWGSGGLASQSIVPGGSGGFAPASSNAPPNVSADEEFGGWSTAAPVMQAVSSGQAKPATGFAASEDLFSNVWE